MYNIGSCYEKDASSVAEVQSPSLVEPVIFRFHQIAGK